jgi:hypothetical protein
LPAARQRFARDAYLEPWTAFEPMDRLIEAFRLSRELNEVYLAVRWYAELPYVEPTSPWGKLMTGTPPAYARRLLAAEAARPAAARPPVPWPAR